MSRRWRAVLTAPGSVLGIVVLAAVIVIAVLGPIWHDEAVRQSVAQARQSISGAHWLGTDALGRDVLARILAGTRTSLLLAAAAVLLGAVLGMPFGALSGLLPPRLRRISARVIALGLAFPGILTALFITAILGPGIIGSVLAIGLALTPGFARLAQTLGSAVAASDHVAAAKVLGVPRGALLRRYVLPNIAEPLLITLTMALADALIALAGLSYLGLGVQPPEFDWGVVLGEGLKAIYTTPAMALGAGAAIVITGLAFNLIGEGMAQGFAGGRPVGSRAARRMANMVVPVRGRVPASAPGAALRVAGLSVEFPGADGPVRPVRDVTFTVGAGEMVGIVGESGSGKSLTALAAAGLVPHPGRVTADELRIAGEESTELNPAQLRELLGTGLAMVFQDPMTSLNPALRIGRQLTEKLEVHAGMERAAATEAAARGLADVQISAVQRRLRQFPHEMSGGMRQRVMIAMGMLGSPSLLIADEPTTALDVTVQAEIVDMLRRLNAEHGMAVVLISHDISVVGQLCDRVLVMYGGRIVEQAPTAELLRDPRHPYTRALLDAVPTLETERSRPLVAIAGQPPHPDALPPGCPFAPRCPSADDRCHSELPMPVVRADREIACWHPIDAELRVGVS